ncbi:MAG: hypothetical protein EXS29_06140 [Pedosphaera sp.]|nr:hypothetical protein [Pedosphaera sp.]
MNLPNYFLADLPPEAALTPAMVAEACRALKRNRERYLLDRPTTQLVRVIARIADNWRDAEFPFRKFALDLGPAATGFSRATLAAGLDTFFARLTEENLNLLLEQEFGDTRRLDEFAASPSERLEKRSALAQGPALIAHIAAGNLPCPALMSIIHGLLVHSAQFLKCARGTALLPRLFAHSLYDAEPKLGACLEIAEWPGGTLSVEDALFAEADCVTATGTDETLTAIRQRLPQHARFLGHGHRVSFGYLTCDSLTHAQARLLAQQAARDVAAWDQQGCLSPHLFYVENGGAISGERFAELLAKELENHEQLVPRGPLDVASAASIATRRAFYEVRAAHSPETRQWCSTDSTAWTVVYEADARFQISCLNRFVFVKEINDLNEVLRAAETVRGQISTIGLAASAASAKEIARKFAQWGATRICPLGQMQNPPLTWRQDGRAPLNELVTWTDWEH